jgi:hypothetical protein
MFACAWEKPIIVKLCMWALRVAEELAVVMDFLNILDFHMCLVNIQPI